MQPTFTPDRIAAHRLLADLGSGRATATYRDNEPIYKQGEDANSVFFVQQGRVELTVKPENGPERVLGSANEGQFFGEACLHEVPVRIASATSIGESRITSITKEAILSAIQDRSGRAKLFIDYLLDHNSWVQKYSLDHLLVGGPAAA